MNRAARKAIKEVIIKGLCYSGVLNRACSYGSG